MAPLLWGVEGESQKPPLVVGVIAELGYLDKGVCDPSFGANSGCPALGVFPGCAERGVPPVGCHGEAKEMGLADKGVDTS